MKLMLQTADTGSTLSPLLACPTNTPVGRLHVFLQLMGKADESFSFSIHTGDQPVGELKPDQDHANKKIKLDHLIITIDSPLLRNFTELLFTKIKLRPAKLKFRVIHPEMIMKQPLFDILVILYI